MIFSKHLYVMEIHVNFNFWKSHLLVLGHFFYARDRRSGGILVFGLSLILPCRKPVWNNNFWLVKSIALIFYMSIPSGNNLLWETVLTLDLGVDLFFKNINLANNFWSVMLELSYFTWIFLMKRPFRLYHIFDHVTLPLEFDLFLKKHLANTFCSVSANAFIFYMSILLDKSYL